MERTYLISFILNFTLFKRFRYETEFKNNSSVLVSPKKMRLDTTSRHAILTAIKMSPRLQKEQHFIDFFFVMPWPLEYLLR